MDINGLSAIVAGAASWLGHATARMLAANGAKITIFDLNGDFGQKTKEGHGGIVVKVNLADEASVNAGLDQAGEVNGVACIPVNCAGIAPARLCCGSPASISSNLCRDAQAMVAVSCSLVLARANRLDPVDLPQSADPARPLAREELRGPF